MNQVVVKVARIQIWEFSVQRCGQKCNLQKKKKNATCNVMIQRKFAERRNGSRAPHFKGWVKEKRAMGGHQDGKIGEKVSCRKGAPVIRAFPGEIRAEKPQDVFGDFS